MTRLRCGLGLKVPAADGIKLFKSKCYPLFVICSDATFTEVTDNELKGSWMCQHVYIGVPLVLYQRVKDQSTDVSLSLANVYDSYLHQ